MRKIFFGFVGLVMSTGTPYANTVSVPTQDHMPQGGTLRHDHLMVVLAQPGECPAQYKGRVVTWYHALVGGNNDLNISRATRRCVVIDTEAIKSSATGWNEEKDAPSARARAAPSHVVVANAQGGVCPRTVDREPASGELGAGEVVCVRNSNRIACGSGQIARIVGASGKDGRRMRSCISRS